MAKVELRLDHPEGVSLPAGSTSHMMRRAAALCYWKSVNSRHFAMPSFDFSKFDWTAVAALGQWASATATLAVVWIAVIVQRRLAKRDQPSVTIGFEANNPECLRYVSPEFAAAGFEPRLVSPSNREELWVRLVVRNTQRAAARDVQVRMMGVLREHDTEAENRSNLWFKAANLNSHSIDLLPRRIPFYFDIGFVRHLIPSNEMSFHLMLVRPPLADWPKEQARAEADTRNQLALGWTYTVFVAVLSANADAVEYQFTLRVKPQLEGGKTAYSALERAVLAQLLTIESGERKVLPR